MDYLLLQAEIIKKNLRNLFYYLTMNEQIGIKLNSSGYLIKEIEKLSPKNLHWEFIRNENEDHISCFFIDFYNAHRDLHMPNKNMRN